MLTQFIEFEKELSQINENNFDEIAWRHFQFQASHNEVYSTYLKHLKVDPQIVKSLEKIPFLPIRFFKSNEVKTSQWPTQRTFQSSGTTESVRSTHHLWDESLYLQHSANTFEKFFGPLSRFHVLALLPYYDTGQSSLIAMTRHFVAKSGSEYSGFFLSDTQRLIDLIHRLKSSERKVLLLGVSHALLDFAEQGPFFFDNLLVMETGGMKGRKEEITRAELHDKIQLGLGVQAVCSEYGMTELCSQAYSTSKGIFQCASSMKVIIKEINDPFSVSKSTGLINVIDLANFHSCSFIETQDLGRVTAEGFEVLGRVDNSEARGCNLMLS